LLEELEAELDEDFDLGGFREKRMMELQAQSVSALLCVTRYNSSSLLTRIVTCAQI
jgi:hypothetical protein